ncbi:MAG: hypothetical protein GTN69_01180 [Armatimonadetes bacterium]|nr:hypothetical protein [Armatimonadota bacterium]NIO74518.1 hypothetical protein [Armatimonadota bacterium]NIO98347.1 hypothetical protein [Armatimonadota bacterium]
MRWTRLHEWEVTPEEGERIQVSLAGRARSAEVHQPSESPLLLAGAAVAERAAAVVVLETKGWQVVEAKRIEVPCSSAEELRYRRGLMAFTFGPPLLQVFEEIESSPDIVFFRAHGLAHPRRCGMATHLGLLLGVPSIGCAEKLLCGEYTPPGPHRGDWSPVTDESETVGTCVRTREGSKPVFVSPGYGLDVRGAVQMALQCTVQHRWPEPLRQARLFARAGEAG